MGYDIGRAALACLSVLTVVFAASQFPAAGIGSYPGGIGADADPGTVTGPTDPGDGPRETTSVTPTNSDETTTSASETATPTPTETSTPEPDRDDDNEQFVLPLLFVMFAVPVFALSMLALGMATGVVAVAAGGPTALFVLEVGGRKIHVGAALRGLSRASMGFVFGITSATSRLASGLGSALRDAGRALGALGESSSRVLTELPAALGCGLAAAAIGLGGALVSTTVGLGSMLAGLGSRGRGQPAESTPSDDARDVDDAGPSADDAEDQRPPPRTVEEVWSRFVKELPLPNARARTPGEFARVAVGRGFPADAVERLTRTFREIRYGGRRDSDVRFERARAAWTRIRNHRTGGDDS